MNRMKQWKRWVSVIAASVLTMGTSLGSELSKGNLIDHGEFGLTDEHMAELLFKVKSYVNFKPPGKDTFRLYDPLDGEEVLIRHVETRLTDDCFRNLGGGYLLVCADFVDAEPSLKGKKMVVVKDGKEVEVDVNSYYTVGFLIKAETTSTEVTVDNAPVEVLLAGNMKVEKAGILAKNGIVLRKWEKNEKGTWITRVAKPTDADPSQAVVPGEAISKQAIASTAISATEAAEIKTNKKQVQAEQAALAAPATIAEALTRIEEKLREMEDRQYRIEQQVNQLSTR